MPTGLSFAVGQFEKIIRQSPLHERRTEGEGGQNAQAITLLVRAVFLPPRPWRQEKPSERGVVTRTTKGGGRGAEQSFVLSAITVFRTVVVVVVVV